MARSRKYGWNGELPAKELSGQAKIVFDGMKALPDTLATGKEWTEVIGKDLKTRQDPYRVVLYYILILKALGVIKTEEFDINAVTKNAETGTHAVTVKSTAIVEAGTPVLERTEPGDDDGANGQNDSGDDDTDDATDEELDNVDEPVNAE